MAFANKHTHLIGKQVEFKERACTVIRFYIVDKAINDYTVKVSLLVENGFEVETSLENFLDSLGQTGI